MLAGLSSSQENNPKSLAGFELTAVRGKCKNVCHLEEENITGICR